MGVGRQDGHLLKLFGAHVKQAFGHTPYQVGSSLTQKGGWRDVDVRLILPDDEYAAFFGDPFKPGHDAPRRVMWDLAWTTLGKRMTGLPIDFQFQQRTIANTTEEGEGPRSALLLLSEDLPLVAVAARRLSFTLENARRQEDDHA